MRMDELKRGLWGYKKDSVYRYIVSVEEKASERVAEKEARLEKQEEQSKQQIAKLEADLKALREENAALRENQALAFSTLMEAQKYAGQLREDSLCREQQAREEFSAVLQQKVRQLEGYLDSIQRFRETVQELLKEFDGKADDTQRALLRLQAMAPGNELAGRGPASGVRPSGEGAPARDEAPAAGLSMLRGEQGKKPQESEPWKNISFI